MGADLICYIMKGPVKLPKNSPKLVEKYLLSLRKKIHKNPKKCENCGNKITDVLFGQECSCGWPIIPPNITDEEIKQMAEDWVNEWNEFDHRDCGWRVDPDNPKRKIVVAGDMSWGDEPEGYGYQFLKKIFVTGVDKILKIK